MAADVQLRMPTAHRLEHQETIIVTDTVDSPSLRDTIQTSPSDNVENLEPQLGSVAGTSEQLHQPTALVGNLNTSNNLNTSPVSHGKSGKSAKSKTLSDAAGVNSQSTTSDKVKYGELVVLGYVKTLIATSCTSTLSLLCYVSSDEE